MKTSSFLFALLLLLPLAGASGQGTIRATTRVLPDSSTLTTVTDPDARTRTETIARPDGQVLRTTLYTLNDQNFATGAAHYDATGKLRYKEVYKFDPSGRIVESKLYAADNRPLGRRVYVFEGKDKAVIEDYDAAGKLISKAKAAPGQQPGGTQPAPDIRKGLQR